MVEGVTRESSMVWLRPLSGLATWISNGEYFMSLGTAYCYWSDNRYMSTSSPPPSVPRNDAWNSAGPLYGFIQSFSGHGFHLILVEFGNMKGTKKFIMEQHIRAGSPRIPSRSPRATHSPAYHSKQMMFSFCSSPTHGRRPLWTEKMGTDTKGRVAKAVLEHLPGILKQLRSKPPHWILIYTTRTIMLGSQVLRQPQRQRCVWFFEWQHTTNIAGWFWVPLAVMFSTILGERLQIALRKCWRKKNFKDGGKLLHLQSWPFLGTHSRPWNYLKRCLMGFWFDFVWRNDGIDIFDVLRFVSWAQCLILFAPTPGW